MLTLASDPPNLLRRQFSIATMTRVVLEPLVILGTLLISIALCESAFEGHHLLLSLIVFFLTFPGRVFSSTSAGALLKEVLLGWLSIVVILLFLGYATRSLRAFSETTLWLWFAITPFALFVTQRFAPVVLPRLLSLEGVRRSAIVVGAGELGNRLAKQLETSKMLGISFEGYFDDRARSRLPAQEAGLLLGRMQDITAYVKRRDINLIFVTLPMASQPRIMQLLDELYDTTVSVYFVPDIFLFDLIQARIDHINGIPVVAACETPFYGFNGLIKRLSDIALSCGILALVSPLLLMIALGVKLSSRGPILFKQRRYGVDGREILIYKFRSMAVLEDGNQILQATRKDRRITPFGRFLRRTSLDELPQFFNVLQGRMSIVGPRPHAVAHNELYRKLIKGYMMRHKVKPGITGWAQVNGYRGETDTVEKMKARIEYDLDYLRHWSLRLDIQIILRSVLIIFKDQHAF
jgi:putative colanic acid biosysnthesis UDP-glucose lipid carrier transferase